MKPAPQNDRQARRSRPVQRSRAFTLIELLVVISIIALLIGILLPALGAARFSARSVACLTKHQQLGVAMAAYTNDNDGYFTAKSIGRADGFPHKSWDDLLAEGGYDGRDAKSAFTSPTGFYGINFAGAQFDAPLYECPLDTVRPRGPFLAPSTNPNHRTRSYAINFLSINTTTGEPNALHPGIAGEDISVRADFVSAGSDTIVLADAAGTTVSATGQLYAQNTISTWNNSSIVPFAYDPDGDPALIARVAGHHINGSTAGPGGATTSVVANFAYADGHASSQANETLFEGQGSPFNYNNTQWDAQR